ncbi:MAG TPA: DHH family phosphoesterase [Candidatus Saccharimonadales bacterium]|nr:DHH family phosphoesterase [Candidatus Saccharimonadales bacterium]
MQEQIRDLVASAHKIVVVQADNPDADSLGSALALEHILGDLGKEVYLYCGVDVPTYLRYFSGWDRVLNELPSSFDASVIVDANTYTLFGQLEKRGQWGVLKNKPAIVLDHHGSVDKPLDFAAVSVVNDQAAATGEIIFHLARDLGWNVNLEAAAHLMSTILGDTQGLMNDKTTADTFRIMAELTDLGVNRALLEELRREYSRMPESIFRYKAQLIERMEFAADGRIAHVTIPQDEINEFSPLYNPAVLVQFDSLQVTDVALSIVFKTYDHGRVTGKLRCNYSAPVADKLAEHFGGGGHPHSAGFKVEGNKPFNEIKSECIEYATQLLNDLRQEQPDDNH